VPQRSSGIENRRGVRSGSGRSIGRKRPTVSLAGRHETDHRSFGEDQRAGSSPRDISPRELEVLKLLALGRSNKEVATALDLSVKTVDAHRSNIMRKLNFRTYSDLIQFAIRHQIVEI
jgi:DNA-binding NarL/FixJ family response regulator